MKIIKILIVLLFFSQQTKAQNIENPSFDSIYIGAIDRIFAWITSDSWPMQQHDTIHPLNPLEHYLPMGLQYHEAYASVQIEFSNAYDGSYAVNLFSDSGRVDVLGNTFRGFVINGDHFYTDSSGYLDVAKCGAPFTSRPGKLVGYYKFSDSSPSLHNYPEAIVILKKYNSVTQSSDTIGFASASLQFFQTQTWRQFEVPINYLDTVTNPDTIVVAFFSASLAYPSMFSIDSIGFDYSIPTTIDKNETDLAEKVFYHDQSLNKIYFLDKTAVRSIKFYDMNGKVIFEKVSSAEVDISSLSKGNYLMSVGFANNKRSVFKIMR